MINNKFIIKTNKGYICNQKANGVYTQRVPDFYNHYMSGGGFFGMNGCSNDTVDKLGFTDDVNEATTFFACIGNRVQEIIDRINYGFEDIKEITLQLIPDVSHLKHVKPNYEWAVNVKKEK